MLKKEKFNCRKCGKYVEINSQMFKKRPSGNGDKVCRKCYYDLFKSSTPVKSDKYPERIKHLLHRKSFEYNDIKDFIEDFKTKKKVKFKCMCCGNDEEMQINSMRRRKIVGTKPICRKCSLSYATSSDEWKKSNSDAQFIAQNRKEVKEKQRKAQNDLMENDPLYIEKRRSNSFISGEIEGIYFDSSWELFYKEGSRKPHLLWVGWFK